MITYIIAGIAVLSFALNALMFFLNINKVSKFESNCIATMKQQIKQLEGENQLQWKRIDEFRAEIVGKFDKMNETVIRFDERTRMNETFHAIVNKAINGG